MSLQVIETSKGKQIGNTHYKIELIDTNRETDINIAQELVAGGFARPSRELAEVQTTNMCSYIVWQHIKFPRSDYVI